MTVSFTLHMERVTVCGMNFDAIIIQWNEEMDDTSILRVSYEWINTSHFLVSRMDGLERVGESALTIEPVE